MIAKRKSFDSSGVFAGLLIIAVGVIFLLDRNGIVQARELFRFWPVVVIGAGIAKLVQPCRDTGARILGVILVLGGSVLLSNSLGYTDVRFGDIWPVAIIAVGAGLLWRSLEGGRRFGNAAQSGFDPTRLDQSEPAAPGCAGPDRTQPWPPPGWASATRLNHWSVFSGFERHISHPDFEGGELFAFFGGSQIDLRHAGLKNGSAVLNATAIFGGIEIRVPETWEVVLRGSGVFGGYVDSTHPLPDPAARTGTLWIQGAAVFGGVEIKN